MHHTPPALAARHRSTATVLAVLLASLLALSISTPAAAGDEGTPDSVLNIVNVADVETVEAGNEASFTVTIWNSGTGGALDVAWHDELPEGIVWMFEVLSTHKPVCGIASSHVFGGVSHQTIDCDLAQLPPGAMVDGFVVRVYAQTDPSHCGTLLNVASARTPGQAQPEEEEEADETTGAVEASATIEVTCPPEEAVETVAGEVDAAEHQEMPATAPMLPDTAATPSPPPSPLPLPAFLLLASLGGLALASVPGQRPLSRRDRTRQ